MPEMSATETEFDNSVRKGSRSAARLGAVQALYQIESAGEPTELVISEFRAWRLGKEIDGDLYAPADEEFFADIVSGTYERLADIDPVIVAALSKGWTLARIERLVLSVIRAGAYELLVRPDVPTPVIINEYLDIAHAFFGQNEPGFVNGVLDRIARQVRPDNAA
ncbi:MAG: transcription antitermination factor NusB [Proteobacteria bacterium]|nr:transcription antitermination factor NusB [Pseudomonadota bacterium]